MPQTLGRAPARSVCLPASSALQTSPPEASGRISGTVARNLQHDLADMLAAFHPAMRLGRVLQRELAVDADDYHLAITVTAL